MIFRLESKVLCLWISRHAARYIHIRENKFILKTLFMSAFLSNFLTQ